MKPGYSSGQRGQSVKLLANASVGSNPSPGTRIIFIADFVQTARTSSDIIQKLFKLILIPGSSMAEQEAVEKFGFYLV